MDYLLSSCVCFLGVLQFLSTASKTCIFRSTGDGRLCETQTAPLLCQMANTFKHLYAVCLSVAVSLSVHHSCHSLLYRFVTTPQNVNEPPFTSCSLVIKKQTTVCLSDGECGTLLVNIVTLWPCLTTAMTYDGSVIWLLWFNWLTVTGTPLVHSNFFIIFFMYAFDLVGRFHSFYLGYRGEFGCEAISDPPFLHSLIGAR